MSAPVSAPELAPKPAPIARLRDRLAKIERGAVGIFTRQEVADARFILAERDALRNALRGLAADVEDVARNSHTDPREPELWEEDWQAEDPDGHAHWSRAVVALHFAAACRVEEAAPCS